MAKRVYNTRKKRLHRLKQMMFCERCGEPFHPTKRWKYVCQHCLSVQGRLQNG